MLPISALSSGIKIGAGVAIGAALGWLVTFVYVEIFTIPDAKLAATDAERTRWQIEIANANAKAQADRDAAQTVINQIEDDFAKRSTANAVQMSALQQAIEQERKNALRPTCTVATPRSVSVALDYIGAHQDSANGPGKSSGPVR